MPQKYNSPSSAPRPAASSGCSGSAPLQTLRLGRIKAAIWENSAEERTFYNVRFTRTYLDDEKKFRDSDSFSRDDLLMLSKLADRVHTFICDRMSSQRSEESAA
jgi:hypothetical protein